MLSLWRVPCQACWRPMSPAAVLIIPLSLLPSPLESDTLVEMPALALLSCVRGHGSQKGLWGQ